MKNQLLTTYRVRGTELSFLLLVRSADPADRSRCDRQTDGQTDGRFSRRLTALKTTLIVGHGQHDNSTTHFESQIFTRKNRPNDDIPDQTYRWKYRNGNTNFGKTIVDLLCRCFHGPTRCQCSLVSGNVLRKVQYQ